MPPKPDKGRPERIHGLVDRVKHILETIINKLDEAERERQIIALLESIDERLERLGRGDEEREAEIVVLLETEFRPIIDGLKNLGSSNTV